MVSQMKAASFSLVEGRIGDFKAIVLERARGATLKVRTIKDNVAGVTIPKFEQYTETGQGSCFPRSSYVF